MWSSKLLLSLALLLPLFLWSQSGSAATTPPGAFVNDLAKRVLAIFNNPKLSPAEQEQQMHAIAVKEFDVPYTARFVLGPYWRSATEQQRADFTSAYENYIVHIYAGQFTLHHDAEFRILSERTETPDRTLVQAEIIQGNGRPPLRVDWRVNKAGDGYKIIDVSVAGISQLVALREQFAELMARDSGGVPMLTKSLQEKSRN